MGLGTIGQMEVVQQISLTPAQPDPHRVVLVGCPEPTLVFGTLYWEIPSDLWALVSLEM